MLKQSWRTIKRLSVIVIGTALILIGIALLVLPGPGLVLIAAGIGVFAMEFEWAKKLLQKIKSRLGSRELPPDVSDAQNNQKDK